MSDSTNYLNLLLSTLVKTITVPTDFASQCQVIQTMLNDDVTGLVDSLTDFSVQTASVEFSIESDNSEYARILNKWLQDINKEYKGRIPTGIDALSKEYYKERWKGSSFPVLKMGNLKPYNGLLLPTRMFFVDGSSIQAKEKDNRGVRHLINYDYYLGNKHTKEYKLDGDNVILAPCFSRWFDKYPVPYLIKRGVYHNWKLINDIKGKQSEILGQIIPYMILIKKGSAELVKENIKAGYTQKELGDVKESIQKLMDKLDDTNTSNDGKTGKSPVRVTNFDENIEHLIPNLENIFKPELTQTGERNILSGLGFIDIVEATSTSRKESVLNPKGFIEEAKAGTKGFGDVMKQIMYYVEEVNKSHKKYLGANSRVVHSPIKGFMTDEFKRQVKRLFDAGKLSAKTTVELVAEVDFETEVLRRKQEARVGIEYIMYPNLIQNQEDKGIDIPEEKPVKTTDKNGNIIPEDKTKPNEKQEYNIGAVKDLERAPYENIKSLPKAVKKNLSPSLQKVFLKVFNQALETYGDESKAFRIAWGVIHKIAKKNKTGKWMKKAKLTKSAIEEVLTKEESDTIETAMKNKDIEIKLKQNELLDKLLGNKNKG